MNLPSKSYHSIVNIIHTLESLCEFTLNWQQVAMLYVLEVRILTYPPISYNQICQKQPSTGALQNSCFEKICKILRDTLRMKSFSIICGPR